MTGTDIPECGYELVTFSAIYQALQASESDGMHLDVMRASGAPWSATLGAAVRQYAVLPDGGIMPLSDLLKFLCVPATVGRAHKMIQMVRSDGIDWQTAFARSEEFPQAASGLGIRTKAYERIKKARQRLAKSGRLDEHNLDGRLVALTADVTADLRVAARLLAEAGFGPAAQRISKMIGVEGLDR